MLGEVSGAELPEFKFQNNAVGEKSIENCSPEESHERPKQDTEEFEGVLSSGIQSHNTVQTPIFGQSGTGQTVHGSGNDMSNNGVVVGRVKLHTTATSNSTSHAHTTATSNSTSHAHTSFSNSTSLGTDYMTTNSHSRDGHDDNTWTGAQFEPDESNDDQNISTETIIFDDEDFDVHNAGQNSSKHNTSSNSSSSGYSSRIRDAADEPSISTGTIFKQKLRNVHRESMGGYHDTSGSWCHLRPDMPDRWEFFSGLGLTPEPGTTYATTGFAYPTSHQLLHLNAAKERKRLRDQEERDSPLYKEKTSKVICINGEDVTDEYNAGNKVRKSFGDEGENISQITKHT